MKVEIKLFALEIRGLEEAISRVAKVRRFVLSEQGTAVHICKGTRGLTVKGNGEYTITYSKRNELFRGLALLVGHLETGKCELDITQASHFETCGVMFDCSRNAVPKVEVLMDLFSRLALMGHNAIMLYMEDTYEIEEYAYFGYMRGKYSIHELKMLDKTAADFGIELIPCVQTLAHLSKTLFWGYAEGMKDTSDILLVGEEKTYEFIEAMFKSLRKSFSTKRIHIGMDEAHGVGRGKYMDKHGMRERFEILCEHIERVCEIAAKYDFQPMMWSDMFFRLGSEDGDYYNKNADIPEWVPGRIPENLSMVYWDYYHDEREMYDGMIKGHKQLEREIIFTGGIWKWLGMAPRYEFSFDTTIPALEACIEGGIKHVFATLWGDDGAEISIYATLLGIQLYAEYNFNPTPNLEQVFESFRLCTGYNAKSFCALGIDDFRQWGQIAISRQVLYQDVLCGLFDKHIACFNLEEFYEKKEECLVAASVPEGLEYLFEYYKTLVKVLKKKSTIGVRIRNAYYKGDKCMMAECAAELYDLHGMVEELLEKAYIMWCTENKMFGYEIFEIRISGVMSRIKTARHRILEWCQGGLERIEELEEKLLWYHSDETEGKLLTCHRYDRIASVNMKSV